MEAIYFGNAKGGLNHGGAGKGPWISKSPEKLLPSKITHAVPRLTFVPTIQNA